MSTNKTKMGMISDYFPTGTSMLFFNAAAPTGWTKQTTHNDKAIRIVSGVPSSGGTVVFSTVFGQTASGTPSTNTSDSTTPGASAGPSTNTSDGPSTNTSDATASGAGSGPSTNTTDGHTLQSGEIPGHTHSNIVAYGGAYHTTAVAGGGDGSAGTGNSGNASTDYGTPGGGSHTHTMGNHTHTGASHTHTLGNHTHTLGSHTHTGAAHTHTMGSHTHPMDIRVLYVDAIICNKD